MTGANLWWHNVLFLALVASKTPLGFGSFKRGQLTTSCLLSMPAVKENKGKIVSPDIYACLGGFSHYE
jgi:hypothetical protein